MLLKYYKKIKEEGFTLIETNISLGLFSLVVSLGVGIFVGGTNYQRKTLELSSVQREGGYLMEVMSRELRMATKICGDVDADCLAADSQRNNNDHDITFRNFNGDWTTYCLSDENGTCDSSGEYFAIDGRRISSSEIRVDNLRFYVNDFGGASLEQKFVTISMDLRAIGKYNSVLTLQTSIAMRIYE